MTSPPTRASLLIRIGDRRNQDAWAGFVAVYAPLIHAYGVRHGLQDADAADLAQEVLVSLIGASADLAYDSSRGAFRGWLFTIARNHLRKLVARRQRQAIGSGDTAVGEWLYAQPDRRTDEATVDAHQRWQRFRRAADLVRGEFRDATWGAFWATAVEGRSAREVAGRLGMSEGAIYIAKSRVVARIRERMRVTGDG
jgi:RNA polymerase sigma-70 factor (ECF subfamily)